MLRKCLLCGQSFVIQLRDSVQAISRCLVLRSAPEQSAYLSKDNAQISGVEIETAGRESRLK